MSAVDKLLDRIALSEVHPPIGCHVLEPGNCSSCAAQFRNERRTVERRYSQLIQDVQNEAVSS